MSQSIMHTTSLTKSSTPYDYVLLDCSSSMTSKWFESLTAIDSYMSQLQRDNVNSQVTMHMFYDQAVDYIYRECPSQEWQPLVGHPDTPMPIGSTPLYDAINSMGLRLRALDPPRCSILILTDGEDTTQERQGHTSLAQARAILDWCRAKGWMVTFIGCDFANKKQADLLGANPESAIGVQRRLLASATEALARKRKAYGLYGTPMHYSEAEQQQFGGYLGGPSGK